MAMRFYDFRCDDCGTAFEAFLGSAGEARQCPKCGSSQSSLQPTLQISISTSGTRRGRVVDMSSNSCPCGARGAHTHNR